MAKIPDIPSVEDVPQDGPLAWLKNWLATLRLWVQLRDPRMTLVGDPLDKFTDRRELVDLGILRRGQDGTFSAGAGGGSGGTTIIYPGGSTGSGDTPDLTPPPAPTGLTADAGMFMVTLIWDVPTYTQGHGNANTIIYGAVWAPGTAEPTFGDPRTKRLAAAEGFSTIYSYPSEANTRWAFWATFLTVDGVEGPPGGGIHGAQATTAQDPSALLVVLTGQIRESHLYRALGDPIRSIIDRSDAAAADTVAALVATHESGRQSRSALLAEAAARGTAITEVRQVVAAGDAQLASQITTLTATVTSNRSEALAAVEDAAFAQAGVDAAQAGRLTALETSVDNPATGLLVRAAALETVISDSSTGNGALAARTSTLEARVTTPSAVPGNPAFNTTYAALVAEASARATLDGNVRALYTVRAEVSAGGRTVVGGFGLAGTASATEGPRIDFGVRADRFWVGAPDDGSAPGIGDVQPFFIQTSPTTINGVAVPAGTYIADAFIRNGTITNVKIANAAIDDAKVANLSAAKLTAGSIAVGAYIQSTGYTGSGTNEWRIDGNGVARFSGVIVSGTVYATAGQIGGNTIDATGVQSPGYSAPTSGWRLDSSGVVRAFASGGTRVLDMAATGTQPVLKIGSALELLANGDAYFGGRLAVGTVSANGSTTASENFPSLPNSTATYSTGSIAFSPSASITGVGGNISAWVSCDVRVAAESTAVEAIRVFAYLYRNGTQVDSSEVFLRACVFPDATGATRTVAAEVTLLSPLQPLTGAQVFTIGFDVKFYNAAGAAVSPGPTAFTSYLQVVGRANLQEIKV